MKRITVSIPSFEEFSSGEDLCVVTGEDPCEKIAG